MFDFLKNHPFAVEAFFEESTVLTYAVPKVQLETLIPECLTLDTFDDQWAFVAIAMVQTKALRPKSFPKYMGNNFFLIGYRIFVRYTTNRDKKLRGLYILKSETNKRKMQLLGNFFTHYNYTTTDITQTTTDAYHQITSIKSNFAIKIANTMKAISLPKDSPFTDWKEARKYAGPLPFTFTYDEITKEVLIIEGVRQNWKPEPIQVLSAHNSFMEASAFQGAVLANAFKIENIPYYWKKGRKEIWK